jgi:hypothetical protein
VGQARCWYKPRDRFNVAERLGTSLFVILASVLPSPLQNLTDNSRKRLSLLFSVHLPWSISTASEHKQLHLFFFLPVRFKTNEYVKLVTADGQVEMNVRSSDVMGSLCLLDINQNSNNVHKKCCFFFATKWTDKTEIIKAVDAWR